MPERAFLPSTGSVFQRFLLFAAAFLTGLVFCIALSPSTGQAQSKYEIADKLQLLPTPRKISLDGGSIDLSANWEIVLAGDHNLVGIGAEEINDRIREIGGAALPVVSSPTPGRKSIIVGRWSDAHIIDVTEDFDIHLAPNKPGKQGYVIRFGRYEGREVVLLGGSDTQGALYACVTFRRLIQPGDGGAAALRADVRDWPDFIYRNNGTLGLGALRGTGATLKNMKPLYAAADELKQKVDWFLRHKINHIRVRYLFPSEDTPNALYEEQRELAMEVLQYAHKRGIQTRFGGNAEISAYLTPSEREVAYERDPGTSYMWAALDAHREKARRYARFLGEGKAGMLAFHPLDSGGFIDPERWSERSPQTRERYGDDRTQAEFEQFKIYFDAAREKRPNIMLEAVSLPYHFQWTRDEFPENYASWTDGMPHDGWMGSVESSEHARKLQKELTNHHRRLGELLDQDVSITFREASREAFIGATELYPGHPITIWIYPGRNYGWLGTFTPQMRMTKTFWVPGREDYYYLASDMTRTGDSRTHRLTQQEYLWNVDRPDASEDFTIFVRFYENGGQTVSDFQRDHLIPRLSEIVYGEMSDVFTDLTRQNVSLFYVANPGRVGGTGFAAEDFDDPYKYMDEQATAFDELHRRFEARLADIASDFSDLRAAQADQWTVFYYRYSGLAAIKAQLDATLHRARGLVEEGAPDRAADLARQTVDQLSDLDAEVSRILERSRAAQEKLRTVYTNAPDFGDGDLDALDTLDPNAYRSQFETVIEDAQ